MAFPFYKQHDVMDCGPTCLRMIAKYHGKNFNIGRLRKQAQYGKDGVSLLGIAEAAENIGFKTIGTRLSFEQLVTEAPLPCIVHWQQNHFVVVTPKSTMRQVTIADPGEGVIRLSREEFQKHWLNGLTGPGQQGIALTLEPSAFFHEQEGDKQSRRGWGMLLGLLKGQRKFILQLFLGLLAGSLLQLIVPFLTQSIVDTGINTHNLQFIYIILAAQAMLFLGRTVVEFIRSRLLLYISSRINLQLLSAFWIKLMRLPLHYFDTKKTGDTMQRLADQKRIENFLTGSALSTIFSFANLVLFSIVLLTYNTTVFFIFAAGSILYFCWIRLFLRYRRSLDYTRFNISSKENTATMQLIHGMQEIKLNNAEQLKRWEWESLQASLFKLQFKGLSLNQYQQAGAFFINEGKNILITFIVVKAVLDGQLTLGAMMAIQSIIGQLNGPVEQMIGFSQQLQDAKISLDRLNEIYEVDDEEPATADLLRNLPSDRSISFRDLSFTYAGAGNEPVLQNINLHIPEGKVTAIVGMSGSGKTTLLKLLLKFYDHYRGDIKIGNANLKNISPGFWRSQCGSVMQDGYIFNETIARNIAVTDEYPDYEKLVHAAKTANILSYIDSLPLGFDTLIGAEGNGISAGQKQRILIARAVYKNPHYLFLDEATNALDANNERAIKENLDEFFKGKTVVIVAHRLSTVKDADNIIVLQDGMTIEQGSHELLTAKKSNYYRLVKNQLELGN